MFYTSTQCVFGMRWIFIKIFQFFLKYLPYIKTEMQRLNYAKIILLLRNLVNEFLSKLVFAWRAVITELESPKSFFRRTRSLEISHWAHASSTVSFLAGKIVEMEKYLPNNFAYFLNICKKESIACLSCFLLYFTNDEQENGERRKIRKNVNQ